MNLFNNLLSSLIRHVSVGKMLTNCLTLHRYFNDKGKRLTNFYIKLFVLLFIKIQSIYKY